MMMMMMMMMTRETTTSEVFSSRFVSLSLCLSLSLKNRRCF
jgi:hypothetical protein